jgi:hypothetical protein
MNRFLPPALKSPLRIMLLAGLMLAFAIVCYWIFSPQRRGERTGRIAISEREAALKSQRERSEEGDSIEEPEEDARSIVKADWEAFRAWLNSGPDSEQIALRLKELRSRWVALDPQALAEAIGELLASGDDAATGLSFEVGPQGLLKGWTTLRVFLLDVLAVSDPELAASLARKVASDTTSAEEFAVALRGLARPGLGRASDAELQGLLNHLLSQPSWTQSPGLAEALDLPRFLGSSEAARTLALWHGDGRLRNMALHEFAADHPETVLEVVASDTIPLTPDERASLMARAEVDDPRQMDLVDGYLRREDVSATEIAEFLRLFPLRSATTGYRLYGSPPAPYHADQIAAGDRAALILVDRWLDDPGLAAHHAEFQALKKRLVTWVGQSNSQ